MESLLPQLLPAVSRIPLCVVRGFPTDETLRKPNADKFPRKTPRSKTYRRAIAPISVACVKMTVCSRLLSTICSGNASLRIRRVCLSQLTYIPKIVNWWSAVAICAAGFGQ